MPDKKLTDAEIIKGLEDTLHRIKGAEHLIVPKLGVENLCNGLENALDLINRLQAENERLKTENKLLIDNDVRNKYPNCVLVEKGRIYTRTLEDYDKLIGDIYAEAYKECIEKVKWLWGNYSGYEFKMKLDNLLKELVGEDK